MAKRINMTRERMVALPDILAAARQLFNEQERHMSNRERARLESALAAYTDV